MNTRGSGRLYRVTGANGQTGEDVEITVEAYDEADAARAANRQGLFVSGCVPVGANGSSWAASAPTPPAPSPAPPAPAPPVAAPGRTFAEEVARDPVVQRLVALHPQLAPRVKRLNEDDLVCLSALIPEDMGISYRDSAHVGKLMKNAAKWK
jgi:hypothetical protein